MLKREAVVRLSLVRRLRLDRLGHCGGCCEAVVCR